jgi:hypothetical protein
MTFVDGVIINPLEGVMIDGSVMEDSYKTNVLLWDKFWNKIYSNYYINKKLGLSIGTKVPNASGYYYCNAPNPIDAPENPGYALLEIYTKTAGLFVLNTGYNFYDGYKSSTVLRDLKFTMLPGPPSADKTLSKITKRVESAGTLL